jgi:hypothetical protein
MIKIKYTKYTCPYADTWFADGGQCGWGKECPYCSENIQTKFLKFLARLDKG